MRSRKHFDLGQHLAAGQLPMFMTGKEIQTHLNPYHGDVQESAYHEDESEDNHEVWERKYDESVTNADMGGAEHGDKYSNLAEDIAHEGFKSPRIPVNLNTQEVLGGHHRVAVGAEEHPNHLFPVVHYDNIHEARHQLKEHY